VIWLLTVSTASGMGLAVTERLVELGWNVTILDFNEAKAKAVAERLGSQIFFIKSNVADWDQLSKAFVQSWEKFGRLDFGMSRGLIVCSMADFCSSRKRCSCNRHPVGN
jgi:NAD(P)-dependent dehydrogenase (short-subunit alcohol dehydrogenase family)